MSDNKEPRLVLVRDPNSGFGALYLDGRYVTDFGLADPVEKLLDGDANWVEALECLFENEPFASIGFEVQQRFQPTQEFRGFDYVEHDVYWPYELKDVPFPPPDWYAQFEPPASDAIGVGDF